MTTPNTTVHALEAEFNRESRDEDLNNHQLAVIAVAFFADLHRTGQKEPADHLRLAESWLDQEYNLPASMRHWSATYLARAQVHATLAMAPLTTHLELTKPDGEQVIL